MEKIKELEAKLLATTDFIEQMELEEILYDLKLKEGLITPNECNYDQPSCIGCGS